MDNDQIPDDSIFSTKGISKGFSDSDASHIQMDPVTAMNQGETKSTVWSILRGVSVAVLVVGVIGGGTYYMLSQTATSTQASLDLRKAVKGTVRSVDAKANAFMLTSSISDDEAVKKTGITSWTVKLPPGADFTKLPDLPLPTCYTISSLERNLSDAVPATCVGFLTGGETVVIEYVILKPEVSTIITKKVIKESN